jgi:hypothetical protein
MQQVVWYLQMGAHASKGGTTGSSLSELQLLKSRGVLYLDVADSSVSTCVLSTLHAAATPTCCVLLLPCSDLCAHALCNAGSELSAASAAWRNPHMINLHFVLMEACGASLAGCSCIGV